MNRRTVLLTLVLTAPVYAAAGPGRLMPFLARDAVVREEGEAWALVEKGRQTNPVIVVGVDQQGPRQGWGTGQIRQAATTLRRQLMNITGVNLPVASKPSQAPAYKRPCIYLGADANPLEAFPELSKVDGHGFLIVAKPGAFGTDLHIVSPSGVGVRYGVNFFLMNYAGLRVVMPREVGEIYERRPKLVIPAGLYVLNPGPDFRLRIWSGPSGFVTSDWLADFGGSQRFQYHHNCHRIFDPERFGQTHPEYFPMRSGKYVVPDPESNSAWQPTFSNPSTAQRAIEYADEAFKERPDLLSISLSVNDGLGYSEKDLRLGQRLPDGGISISKVYYEFVNAVARGVRKNWAARYVAFLPYNRVSQPPDFKLEDNVMVFLFNEPKTSYEAWQGKASRIGIYQWVYGIGWVLPNHWPRAIRDYLKWVYDRGGRAFKGEAYVTWAQGGPKMWILNNVLWNVDCDVDALLKDYYEHAYGKEAAPAMARYFAVAERIYERRRTPREFKIARWNPGARQFEHVKQEDIDEMSAALDEAARSAIGENNKRRVDFTTQAFRWGRLYWDQYAAQNRLLKMPVASNEDVDRIFSAANEFGGMPAKQTAYYEEFIKPNLQYCIYARSPDRESKRSMPTFKWEGFDPAADSACDRVSAYWSQSADAAKMAARWLTVGMKHRSLLPYAESQRLKRLHPGAELRNLIDNGGFEAPPGKPKGKREFVSGDWAIYHNRMVAATVSLDREIKRSGHASMTAKGMTDYSGVLRPVRVRTGRRYRLSFWYKTTPKVRHVAIAIMADPRIREHAPPSMEWTQYKRVFMIKPSKRREVTFTILITLRHGGAAEDQAWFDDVRLEMLAPEGIESKR